MLGKSAGSCLFGIVALAALAALAALPACAKNVPQDKATGADGRVKGAKAITLDGGKGRATGVVTYPGGDRVDWKLIELPEDKIGQLRLRLSWIPPRPGIGLGLDVFDGSGKMVESERGGKRKSNRRNRRATVAPARGKYWVRVYAPGRGDAGKYTLKVAFDDKVTDIGGAEIPDPPRLPAVPEAEVDCDPFAFDKKNPTCRNVCPNPPDPSWPACKNVCPNLPVGDANLAACWPVMDCPAAPDRRIRKCRDKFPPCNYAARDPQNPNCDGPAPPVKGKVINVQATSDGVIITVNKGQDKSVEKGWSGKILKKGTRRPMDGGDFTVIRVGKRESVGKVTGLTSDQVSANRDVLLEAP